jgi:hypothetical protein
MPLKCFMRVLSKRSLTASILACWFSIGRSLLVLVRAHCKSSCFLFVSCHSCTVRWPFWNVHRTIPFTIIEAPTHTYRAVAHQFVLH